MLLWILIATLGISLSSFAGLVLLAGKIDVSKLTMWLIALAAGTMLGNTFFHLLPEAAMEFEGTNYLPLTLMAFIGFFILEKFLHWRHCHEGECDTHGSFGMVNLIGDGVHNFTDGVLIAAAFSTDFWLGVTTTLAIALHEIPAEIGDFGVLLHSGFSKRQALIANFGSGLSAIFGGLVGYFLLSQASELLPYFVIMAAGSFLYIGMSDLIPELRKTDDWRKLLSSFAVFMVGVGLMWMISNSNEHGHSHDADHEELHLDYVNAEIGHEDHESNIENNDHERDLDSDMDHVDH